LLSQDKYLGLCGKIAILRDTEEMVKQVCRKLIMMASKVGLEINNEKQST
jgi:hypothetical protein